MGCQFPEAVWKIKFKNAQTLMEQKCAVATAFFCQEIHQICFWTFQLAFIQKNHLFLLVEDRVRIATKNSVCLQQTKMFAYRESLFLRKINNLSVLANASSCSKQIKPVTIHCFTPGMLRFNIIRLAQCLCQANKQYKKFFYVADNLLKIGGILKCTPT